MSRIFTLPVSKDIIDLASIVTIRSIKEDYKYIEPYMFTVHVCKQQNENFIIFGCDTLEEAILDRNALVAAWQAYTSQEDLGGNFDSAENNTVVLEVTENKSIGAVSPHRLVRVFLARDYTYGYWVPEQDLYNHLTSQDKLKYLQENNTFKTNIPAEVSLAIQALSVYPKKST